MTEQDIINEAIRNSTGAWFESENCKIYGKDRAKGVFTPKQNYLQAKAQAIVDKMQDLGLPIRIMGLKPRQKGSTTYFSSMVYTRCRRAAASAVLIGGQFSQVSECWGMMQTYNKHDRFDWKNTGEINTKAGAWSNGSKLIGETAKDVLAGVGGTHQVVHGFEVARWAKHGVANSAEVLANILKGVPLLPDTMVILESTAEGATGDFYDRFVRAIDGDDFLAGLVTPEIGQYVRCFAAWFEFDDSALRLTEERRQYIQDTIDADEEYFGERDLINVYGRDDNGVTRLGTSVTDFDVWEQLAWRRLMISEECKGDKNIFDRDYPKSWQTAFQKSGGMRFNSAGLEMMKKRTGRVVPLFGIIEEEKRRYAFRQSDKLSATTTIFEKPINGCKYIIPVDVMTGESQVGGLDPDKHGIFVLRAGYYGPGGKYIRAATAGRLVSNMWDIDVLEEHVWRLSRYYGGQTGAKIAIEMNQDRGLTELLKKRGANLYQREIFNQREFKMSKAFGYSTNAKTREVLIERLAKAIREWADPIEGLDIFCPDAIAQCENFIRKANGRSEAADGWHDDDVISLALGMELMEHATTYVGPAQFFGSPPEDRQKGGRPQGIGSAYS